MILARPIADFRRMRALAWIFAAAVLAAAAPGTADAATRAGIISGDRCSGTWQAARG